VARTLGLVSILTALAVGGWLLTSGLGGGGERAAGPLAQAQRAEDAASATAFAQAVTELEAARAVAGTYAGATLSVPGVRLARADAAGFCVETGGLHLAGPGGSPVPGPC
jgi:hypothetical protein